MVKNKGIGQGEIEGLKIGNKIRELRQKRHYTVEDLATKTDLPKSLLTEIESGEVSPPIATLIKLAKALNVGMAYFFDEVEKAVHISVTRAGERIVVKRRPHHHEGEVDYIYESLEMNKPDKHMEPFLVEFKPMDRSDMIFMSHRGEEFLYLLEGDLEFRTDDRVEVLTSGDAIYFESEINHSFRALKETARAVVVVWSET
jgi:transcriptional regulator with XRE-family HTH domain